MTIQMRVSVLTYIPQTGRSNGDVDLGLKSDMKDWRSDMKDWRSPWDQTHDPWVTRRAALHYTIEVPFPNISYC